MAASTTCVSSGALAQTTATWTGNRTTPVLGELVAIDATGEDGWPYGAEDIAGDQGTFQQTEQSLDIRTAYATTDASDFWTRVYVSDPNNVGGNVTVYVFVDNDETASSGCGADATEIDAALDADPSLGGYEYVIALKGNGTLVELYECQGADFVALDPLPAGIIPEGGTDTDPIDLGGEEHGYVQAQIPTSVIGLTGDCNARLFFRSVNESAATTASDLNVGEAATCRPADVNDDGIPDIVVPPECQSNADCPSGATCDNGMCVLGCQSDADCPAGGACINGECVLAASCVEDTDCEPDEECAPDGHCVVTPTGNCDTTADCNDLVCISSECVPCTTANATCASGEACAPDGRCVTGTPGGGGSGAGGSSGGGVGGGVGPGNLLNPDEEVQGGACTCRTLPANSRNTGIASTLAILFGLSVALRRSARRHS